MRARVSWGAGEDYHATAVTEVAARFVYYQLVLRARDCGWLSVVRCVLAGAKIRGFLVARWCRHAG